MYRNNDPMKAYMQDISVIPLVSKEEEIDLARRIKERDWQAKQKLINANLRLVVKIAHDFKGLGLPLLDLISEGNIGLIRAAEKFDPAKGAKFSSYSAWWIKQSMRRALSQKSRTIRVPVASAGKISKIRTARMQLTEKLGRAPTDHEIAECLNLTKRTIQSLKMADLKTFSMHDPIQKGEDGSFEDIIPDALASTPGDIVNESEMIHRLRGLIHNLDQREQTILTLRYGLDGSRPKTLEEVSVLIGRTRERVRQIQMQALKKLKGLIEDENFDDAGHYRRLPTAAEAMNGRRSAGSAKSHGVHDHHGFARTAEAIGRNSRAGNPWSDASGQVKSVPIIESCFDLRPSARRQDILKACNKPLEALDISRRSVNGLHSVHIRTVAELAMRSVEDLLSIRYFGTRCLTEVQTALVKYVQSIR